MQRHRTQESSQFQPTQRANSPVEVTVEDDTDTEVGSTVLTPTATEAGDMFFAGEDDGARATGEEFSTCNRDLTTAASITAIVRRKCRFRVLDNVIKLYDSLESRFEDNLGTWSKVYGDYLWEISQAVREIVQEIGPQSQNLPRKGRLHDTSIRVGVVFREKWCVESYMQFQGASASTPAASDGHGGQRAGKIPISGQDLYWDSRVVADLMFPVATTNLPQPARYPPNMGPPDSDSKKEWDEYKYPERFSLDSKKRPQERENEGPCSLAQLKMNRQHVRDVLISPLTAAIEGWKNEGNRDIEEMKQILWDQLSVNLAA